MSDCLDLVCGVFLKIMALIMCFETVTVTRNKFRDIAGNWVKGKFYSYNIDAISKTRNRIKG